MLFKLSMKNIKKSFKDYAIYFLTLVLGVAIFYMFNSLDAQEAMLKVSESTRTLITLMVNMLGLVSIFVAVVLGFLIVYANNFLINRRKKEFGIYMMLGMKKRQISKILLFETILIGIISLAVGLFIGVFASQFMSVLVAKLFEADMSEFIFVFSKAACIKTCIYFAIMYIAVMIFNTITISKYKLINLLNASKKNEKIKIKNPIIAIIIFILSVCTLSYAYWKVTGGVNTLDTIEKIIPPIILGVISTFGIFWSLSGFILRLIMARKKIYLNGTNMFVLRQINNKINTTVTSMSVICLMLFMTISILSSSLSLQRTMSKELKEMTPVDINLYKTANLPESNLNKYTGKTIYYTDVQRKDSKVLVSETLKNNGFDISKFKDMVEIPIYAIPEWTMEKSLGSSYEKAKANYPMMRFETPETVIKVSDYNKIASLYGLEEYSLAENEYIVLCDFDSIGAIRNEGLRENKDIVIEGKKLHPKYLECKEGFIVMSTSHVNSGIILVPDTFNLKEEWKEQYFLASNYNSSSEEEKIEIEKELVDEESKLVKTLKGKAIELDGISKITIMEGSKGVSTMIVFIAIYLGIIFLIASSAILALKQLTESSDNKQRYTILRKIGCSEKMINGALFKQIAIFFTLPLILAIIHSIFGIQFALTMMSALASAEELLPSIIGAFVIIGLIYGLYFIATYLGSKSIIKEE